MNTLLPHVIFNNSFIVNAARTLFWEQKKILILSDLHLGKSGHFRKAGIAIPQNIIQQDLFSLSNQIQIQQPDALIIVGDLFHSHSNKEHDYFVRWRKNYSHIVIHLVMGNHDILQQQFYEQNELQVHKKMLQIDNFIFAHDINDLTIEPFKYYFSGHIHPSVVLQGLGKQYVKLPCFYFTEQYAVLPAFGRFTGTYNITPGKNETVYGIIQNKVLQL